MSKKNLKREDVFPVLFVFLFVFRLVLLWLRFPTGPNWRPPQRRLRSPGLPGAKDGEGHGGSRRPPAGGGLGGVFFFCFEDPRCLYFLQLNLLMIVQSRVPSSLFSYAESKKPLVEVVLTN